MALLSKTIARRGAQKVPFRFPTKFQFSSPFGTFFKAKACNKFSIVEGRLPNMSSNQLRHLVNELFTTYEIAVLLKTNPSKIQLFRQGADNLNSGELATLSAHVRAKLDELNRVAAPSNASGVQASV